MRKIILASASPRRKRLLEQIRIPFTIDVSSFNEDLTLNLKPHDLVKYLSLQKGRDVASRHKDAIIIAADTLVVIKGHVMGKPKTHQEARLMLKKLSGTVHSIITGFTIIDTSSSKTISKSVESKIHMRKLTNAEINAYVNTGEPMDKAGAYGIQERGGLFVKKTEGDFNNIVGLPLYDLAQELKKFGVQIL